jgi:hypothetical protein
LDALLAHTAERVLVVDDAGVVVLVSAAAAEAWGAAPGKAVADLPVPPDARTVAIGGGAEGDGARLVVSSSWAHSGAG